jgi:hypothetical protein
MKIEGCYLFEGITKQLFLLRVITDTAHEKIYDLFYGREVV